MHNKFDEEFRYSKGHIPRIFKSSKEIKIIFTKARNSSLQLINLFFYLSSIGLALLINTFIMPCFSSQYFLNSKKILVFNFS